MKSKFLISLVWIGAVLLTSCNDPAETGLSDEDIMQQVLDNIEKNEGISYPIFQILRERIKADSLLTLKKSAPSKEDFINVMARQTEGYFNETVENEITDFSIAVVPTPFAGEAEITLKGLAGKAGATGSLNPDLVNDYSDLITRQIETQSKDGRDKWIVIDANSSTEAPSSQSKPKPQPQESISLNYEKIKFLATVPHTVILNMDLSDEEMLTSISDILNEKEVPPVAIGLLLPAVQKVREAAASEGEPFTEAMNTWLDGPVSQAINGGLNRDIIRRIQASVYLAALHTILLDEYNGSTVDMASLSILHARYRAAVVTGSEIVWGN